VTIKVCPSVASGEVATEIKPAQLTPKKIIYVYMYKDRLG